MTNRKPDIDVLSEQELDAVAAGGRSQCEGDDGSASGGSKPKPKPSGGGGSHHGAMIFDSANP